MARTRDERQGSGSLRAWLGRPFPLWRGVWPETQFVLLATAVATGVVLATRPFGLGALPDAAAVPLILKLAAACAAAGLVTRVATPALVERAWDDSRWSVAHELVWTCLEVVVIAAALMAVMAAGGHIALTPATALVFLGVTGLCAIAPMTVRTLLVERWLRDRHERLAAALPPATETPTAGSLRITGQDGVVDLPPGSLRYVRAEQNYVDVVWLADGARRHRLLRATLAEVEAQLAGGPALRCHRSWIVALPAVGKVSGNAQGYRAAIEGLEEAAPVSRSRGPAFLAAVAAQRVP